jgi:chaperonin GroES
LQYNGAILIPQEDDRMKFKPLHDWVLIRRSKAAETTGSGIIIPDTAKDKPAKGIVEAVGPGRYKEEKGKKEKKFFSTVLKPGEEVMFIDYMAKDVALDGVEITLVREDDVLGTIEQGGQLAVKEPYHVEIRKERPPMVQAEPEKAVAKDKAGKTVKTKAKAAAVEVKKPSTPKKEKTAAKKTQKLTPKKAASAKKSKPARKTAVKKTMAKTSGPKKGQTKKAVPKKTSPKKSTVKKVVPKKTAAKKVSAKKPLKKTRK